MSKKLALYSGDKKICNVEESEPEFEKESSGWKKIHDVYVKALPDNIGIHSESIFTPTATSQDKEPPSASE